MDTCTLACCNPADGPPLDSEVVDDLAKGFKALGDAHRVAVIDLLLRAGEPVCVVDIERHLPLAQSTVSYHLKFLVDAGILDRERKGRWMYYTVRPERLHQLQEALARFIDANGSMTELASLVDFGDDRLDATQRAVRSAAFVRLLETGQPTTSAMIARSAETPEHVVDEVLEEMAQRGSVQFDGDGRLSGITGLSVERTRHSIRLPQGVRWTWCALDAIGIVGAVGSGSITSRAPEGSFTLILENGVFHPDGMAILIADGYGMTSSVGQWCPLVDFFRDEISADRWAASNGVAGQGVAVAQIAPVAADRWRAIIDG